MDNLSAYISIKAIELAQKHQVLLICLPPNTTHALQSLDVPTFSMFTIASVSGGSPRAGIWPFDDEAMKEKVDTF
ncbi:unnamed protein product [Adineta steineri]|uniref:DDE-1 domain-containing protein n=1 Tax=Adineta steineri TaxID=433720 RepID=A0A819P5C7_9BILA|nr:unnamed protein product [Adineta steineri]CAF4005172.1 unnamed protein product [Adineta steineri]